MCHCKRHCRMVRRYLILTLLALLLLQSGAEGRNYVMLSTTKPGLRELRLSFRGKLLLETTAIGESLIPNGDLALIQVADSTKLVEIFLKTGMIQDCIVRTSEREVKSFKTEFSTVAPHGTFASLDDVENVYHSSSFSSSLKSKILPTNYKVSPDVEEPESEVTEMPEKTAVSSMVDNTSVTIPSQGFQIAAKVSSLKNINFLQKYQEFVKVRRQARLCREFYKKNEYYVLQSLLPQSSENLFSSISTANQTFQELARMTDLNSNGYSQITLSQNVSYPPQTSYQHQHHHRHNHNLHSGRDKQSNDSSNKKHKNYQESENVQTDKTKMAGSGDDKSASTKGHAPSSKNVDQESLLSKGRSNNKHTHQTSELGKTEATVVDVSLNSDVEKTHSVEGSLSPSNESDNGGFLDDTIEFLDNLLNRTMQESEHLGMFAVNTSKAVHRESSHRSKRSIFGSWVIFPGTKWCGDGDIAKDKNDLGYHELLDRCCRMHDHCPMVIYKLSWKYGLFNYRLHTMSHCRCDRKFRKCLMEANTPLSYLIGRIYFNVVGPQCFKFEKKTACAERYWWGACKRWEKQKVAYPRKQRKFKNEDPSKQKWRKKRKDKTNNAVVSNEIPGT